MSGSQRLSSDFHHIKVREIVVQNVDGSYPPVGSVINVVSDRGKTDWTQDLSLNSVTLAPGGVVTYNGTDLVVNGVPLVNTRYIQDLSGGFDGGGAFVDTTDGDQDSDNVDFTVPVSGYYMISMKYQFTPPTVAPLATNYLVTSVNDITNANVAVDIKNNARYYNYSETGTVLSSSFSADMVMYLVGGAIYTLEVAASGIGAFTVTKALCIRIY